MHSVTYFIQVSRFFQPAVSWKIWAASVLLLYKGTKNHIVEEENPSKQDTPSGKNVPTMHFFQRKMVCIAIII